MADQLMTLAFRADSREEAVARATTWSDKEPRWTIAEVLRVERQDARDWWHLRVRLAPRQRGLGL